MLIKVNTLCPWKNKSLVFPQGPGNIRPSGFKGIGTEYAKSKLFIII
jgi:hypothetical protein